jgi:hypothetical protein
MAAGKWRKILTLGTMTNRPLFLPRHCDKNTVQVVSPSGRSKLNKENN